MNRGNGLRKDCTICGNPPPERVLFALILAAGLAFVAFVGYKISQPLPQAGAHGLTYWQFVSERVSAIRALPAQCQQLHFSGYLIAVPVYPALYTAVGLWLESALARHSQPHPAIDLPSRQPAKIIR